MLITTLINSANALYTDKDFSWLQDLVLTGGYFATQAGARTFKVVQKGTPSMGVDIQVGKILIPFTKASISWKVIVETTGESLTVSANATGAVRADAVIVKLDTTATPNAGKSNVAVAQVIAGTSATPLTDGAIQTAIGATYNFIRLADIMVPNGAVSIVDGNINNVIAKVKLTPAIGVDASALDYSGGLLSTYVTQDNTTVSGTDQTQLTVNGTVEFGEANLTTKKNIIEQSFIPAKTKIRGYTLWKKPDTGTFTGTVTFALQADTAGSPSGTDLATVTLTNSQWYNIAIDSSFEALFSSEYASLVVGNLYWIVARTSTSDNSNHPNLGTNTSGGYASGSLKYKNTPDGHVAISTIDLYFQTLEGNKSQVVKTDTTGKIPENLINLPYLPTQQRLQMPGAGVTSYPCATSSQDGSKMYISSSGQLYMFERDVNTGVYIYKTTTAITGGGDTSCIVVVGLYIYIFYDAGNNVTCTRFLASDLTGLVSMTIPAIDVAGTNYQMHCWTDGLNIYFMQSKAPTTVNKLSISGTTFTIASTAVADTDLQSFGGGKYNMWDGANAYLAILNNPGSANEGLGIKKITTIDGTVATVSTIQVYSQDFNLTYGQVLVPLNTLTMYVGQIGRVDNSGASMMNTLTLTPVTKP